VDELLPQWKAAQAKILFEPEDKPWKLRKFMAADLDGNRARTFLIAPSPLPRDSPTAARTAAFH
jgi:hypothetical protein